jgi:DNA sulfur modification protein DndD
MELKIISWESKGLRCPDGKVNLWENGYKRFNFIQMPNGTGKTTYLELIQYALSGYLRFLDGSEIGKYFHIANSSEESFFELLIDNNSEKVTFRIDFKFDKVAIKNKSKKNNSKATYSTSYSGQGGLKPGYNPPAEMKKMLTNEFVKLFVFDGEFANRLFDPADSKAFQCLDSICQLNILDNMEKSLDTYYKNQVIENEKSRAQTKLGVGKAIKEKEKYENKKNELEQKLFNGEKDIQRLTKEIENIDKEINDDNSLGGNLKKETQEKKEVCDKLENEYNLFVKEYFDLIKNPINLDNHFITALDTVQENLYKLKIPASATRSFFEELVEDQNCICDRPMDQKAKSAININKEKYFDEDRAGIYNNLKTDIREKLKSKDLDKEILDKKNNEFRKLKEQKDNADSDYQLAVNNMKQSAPSNLAEKMTKRDLLINEKKELIKELDEIKNDTNENLSTTKSIKILSREIKKQEEIIEQVKENISLKEHVDIIKALCKNVKKDVKKSVKNKIIQDCNTELQKIFTGKKSIQIEDIEEYITLQNQSSGSEGQKLSVGMLYLSVLLGRENVNFFTIFDSPCGKIDLHVRKDLSEPLVDLVKKNGQFITFVQSGERLDFTTTIEDKVDPKEILYLTIFDKERFSNENLPEIPENKYETNNAIFVKEKNFFNNFRPSTNKNQERATS